MDTPRLLPSDQVEKAVQIMCAINSIESFRKFYDRYQRRSRVQRNQILEAFTIQFPDMEIQDRFYSWWNNFERINEKEVQGTHPEEVRIQSAQAKLEAYLTVNDYQQIVSRFGRAIVEAATARLEDRAKEAVSRIVRFLQEQD